MRLPDSPVGRQATWVLENFGRLVNKGVITERFAPEFLEHISPAKTKAFLLGLKALGSVEVAEVHGDDTQLVAGLDAKRGSFTLQVHVEAEPPHLIDGLLVKPTEPSTQEVLGSSEPSDDVQGLMDEHFGGHAKRVKGPGVGLVAGVVWGDDTIGEAFGGVEESDSFEIGSISKPFTAVLLAELVAAGEVGLEDPISRYLPEGSVEPDHDGPPITLLELATHTSGLPRLATGMEVPDQLDPYKLFTVDWMFANLSKNPIDGRGTVQYSNLGYALLGNLLGIAVGTTYEGAVTERVLQPMGLGDTRLSPRPGSKRSTVAGHAGGKEVPNWTRDAAKPAGGIESTMGDLLRFAEAHLDADSASPPAQTLIKRESRGEEGRHVGLGWMLEETPHGDVFWHNGGTGGFTSFLGFHPDSRTAVAALSNSADEGPDLACKKVLGSLIAK